MRSSKSLKSIWKTKLQKNKRFWFQLFPPNWRDIHTENEKRENYTNTYKHVQVISNDIQDKQTADKQTTCSEPTNWLGFEWMNEWMNEWMDGWMNEWMNKWMNEWMNQLIN